MNFLSKNKLIILGIIGGAVCGYLYYYFVGCKTGTCPISSKPFNSSIYGAVMGALLMSLFKKDEK